MVERAWKHEAHREVQGHEVQNKGLDNHPTTTQILTMKRQTVKHILAFLLAVAASSVGNAEGLTRHVNPLMGTFSSMELSNGNTYPTVCLPFGMNN